MQEPKPPPPPDEPGLTPKEIAELKSRARRPGPFFFGEQVTDRLRALEKEWKRTGGFDMEYMRAFLAQLDEDDPPHYVVRANPA
jgi:hypothetical protein